MRCRAVSGTQGTAQSWLRTGLSGHRGQLRAGSAPGLSGHRGQLRAGSVRVCGDTGDSSELAPHGALAGVVNTANGTGEPGISSSVGLGTLALHSVACSEHGL